MEENSSSQMGRFCSQWLLEIRFPCRDSENSSDYSIESVPECDEKFSVCHGPHGPRSISVVLRRDLPDPVHADHQAVAELQQE